MQQILKNAACDPAAGRSIILSYTFSANRTRTTSIQMVATPIDNNLPVHAEGWLQGTIDKVNWFQIVKLTADGNGIQYDGGPFESLFAQMRFRLETTTNCKVNVFLARREG